MGAEAEGHLKVSELAARLEVPASAVLEQCLRLGIDATWAGADLSPADVAILEAELAHDDPSRTAAEASAPSAAADPGATSASPEAPAEAPAADPVPVPVAAGVGASVPGGEPPADPGDLPVPPTAVGSMPEMTDALMRDAAEGAGATPRTFAGRDLSSGEGLPPTVGSERAASRMTPAPNKKRFDSAVRPGAIALVLAAVALVGSNSLDEPFVIALLWVFGAVALVVAALSGNRARYRITTHPEQRRGLVPAVAILVVAVLGLVGLVTATYVSVRKAPAADAAAGIGDLNSVDHVRWGYRRLTNVANTGWERPAKDEGTCWEDEARKKPRRDERVELGGAQVSCDSAHGFEVLGVFSVNHDTDAPYPGKAELTRIALARCEPKVDRIKSDAAFTVGVEYPTETGWVDGDHDVSCVAIVTRDAPLRD